MFLCGSSPWDGLGPRQSATEYSAGRLERTGRLQPGNPFPKFARFANHVHGRLAAPRAGVQRRGRILPLEERPHLVVSAQDRVARAGAVLLEAMDDVSETTALGPLRVRARRIVEFDAPQEGIQIDLFLRNYPEGLDPRHEPGLSGLVRSHPRELLDVPARDVHQDRLRRVVEVEAGGDVVCFHHAGRPVEGLPAEGPAVTTRNRFRVQGDDLVHRMADALRIREDAVFDPQTGAQPPRVFDSLGTV